MPKIGKIENKNRDRVFVSQFPKSCAPPKTKAHSRSKNNKTLKNSPAQKRNADYYPQETKKRLNIQTPSEKHVKACLEPTCIQKKRLNIRILLENSNSRLLAGNPNETASRKPANETLRSLVAGNAQGRRDTPRRGEEHGPAGTKTFHRDGGGEGPSF